MASANAAPHRSSQAALARTLGVSRQAINDLVRRQIIPMDGDGLIDVELARLAIANRVRPSGKTGAATNAAAPSPAATSASAHAEPDAQMSYHVAKTLREVAEAQMARLRLAEQRADVVRASDVRAAHAKRLAGLREALLQLPARLAPVMAAEADQARCHDALQREIHALLASVSGQ